MTNGRRAASLPAELPWLLRLRSVGVPSRGHALCALVGADLCLFLDAAVRWYYGFGFVGRPRWWLALLSLLAISAGTAWVFTRRPSLGIVHLLVGLLLVTWALMAGGTGNGIVDWSETALAAGIFDRQLTWQTILLDDRFRTTYAGAAIHALWGARYRGAVRRPALTSFDATLLVAGVSLVLFGWLAKSEFILAWDPLRKGLLPAESLVAARSAFLASLGGVGWTCAGIGAGLRLFRWTWLAWVALGKHRHFTLRAAANDSEQGLPVFAGRSLFRRTRVLVHRTGESERAFARVVF